MKVAVVILNWNGSGHLKKYLPNVLENTKYNEHEIIVADNGSSDDSLHVLEDQFPTVNVIKLDKNYGFAEGYNKALFQINADVFVLLNSDVAVSENWLIPLVDRMTKDAQIVVVQPKILSDRNRNLFEHAGAAGGFIDKYGYPFCRGRIMDNIEMDRGQYNQASEIFWASGACMCIRADLYKEMNGLDGDYFAHMEEIDLCWRIKNRGYQIWYEPESVVYHWGGATLDYNNPRKLFLNFRNSLWTLLKNCQEDDLKFTIFKRLLIDGIAAAKFLVTFNFSSVNAVWNGHKEYYKTLKATKEKRAELNQNVTTPHHPEMYNGSIVWAYFAKGFHLFSKIKL